MAYKKEKRKHFSDIELKTLHNEINNGERKMTDDEQKTLIQMFYEKWGNSMYGTCLNPLFLLDNKDNPLWEERVDAVEAEAVKKWCENDSLENFGQERVIPDIDISFLCERPRDCPSFKQNSIACKCIRDRFSSPQAFAIWRQEQIKELGEKIKNLIPTH